MSNELEFESGRLWPVVLGVTIILLMVAGYIWEDRYTRPPKMETAPTHLFAETATGRYLPVAWSKYTGKYRDYYTAIWCDGSELPCVQVRSDRFGDSCTRNYWPVALSVEHMEQRWKDCR